MDDELGRLIDLARIEARRRHHEHTAIEHLLSVVLDVGPLAQSLRERGIDPTELHERLEVSFATRPVVGGYRDASPPPLAAAVEAVVARHRGQRGWLPFVAKRSIVDALLLEPAVATLVFELRRGNDHRYVLERARALAIMRGQQTIGLAHLFRALLDLPSFVRTLEQGGGDAQRLRADVDAVLDEQASAPGPESSRAVSPRFARAGLSIPMQGLCMGGEGVSIRELCLELTRDENAERFWTASGTSAAEFFRAVYVPAGAPWSVSR